MRKILVYLAHPRMDRSQIHARFLPMLHAHPAVTLVKLYSEYPDYFIDVEKEQARLRAHDAIIFEHPVFWYSTPAILKEWQDLVLTYGFAYGREGNALRGKAFGQVISTGQDEENYSRRGAVGMSLRTLFAPLEAMSELCGMTYIPPLSLYSASTAQEEGRLDEFQTAYQSYLDALADRNTALRDIGKRDDLVSTIRKFMRI